MKKTDRPPQCGNKLKSIQEEKLSAKSPFMATVRVGSYVVEKKRIPFEVIKTRIQSNLKSDQTRITAALTKFNTRSMAKIKSDAIPVEQAAPVQSDLPKLEPLPVENNAEKKSAPDSKEQELMNKSLPDIVPASELANGANVAALPDQPQMDKLSVQELTIFFENHGTKAIEASTKPEGDNVSHSDSLIAEDAVIKFMRKTEQRIATDLNLFWKFWMLVYFYQFLIIYLFLGACFKFIFKRNK